jgi:DNA-binding CsgD family transcriptional regulator
LLRECVHSRDRAGRLATIIADFSSALGYLAPSSGVPLLKKSRPEQACGAIVVSPSGRIRSISRRASRYLKEHFAPRPDRHRLPEPLGSWAQSKPETPFCLVKNGSIVFVRLIDRTRKGALHLLLEERVVENGKLTTQEALVVYWLRQGKSSEQIAAIIERKVGTVKKHLARIYDKLGVENRTAAAFYADRLFPAEE